jgi:hypothetical protein
MVAIMRGVVKDGKVIPERPISEGELVENGLVNEDPTRQQWMKLAEQSSIKDLWLHPGEDIYTQQDGKPV